MKPMLYTALLMLSACCIPSNEGGFGYVQSEISSTRIVVDVPPDRDDNEPDPSDNGGDTDGADGGVSNGGGPDDKDTDTGAKGNASANNGKGGNYDKTGHVDNGKGKGRDKK